MAGREIGFPISLCTFSIPQIAILLLLVSAQARLTVGQASPSITSNNGVVMIEGEDVMLNTSAGVNNLSFSSWYQSISSFQIQAQNGNAMLSTSIAAVVAQFSSTISSLSSSIATLRTDLSTTVTELQQERSRAIAMEASLGGTISNGLQGEASRAQSG